MDFGPLSETGGGAAEAPGAADGNSTKYHALDSTADLVVIALCEYTVLTARASPLASLCRLAPRHAEAASEAGACRSCGTTKHERRLISALAVVSPEVVVRSGVWHAHTPIHSFFPLLVTA